MKKLVIVFTMGLMLIGCSKTGTDTDVGTNTIHQQLAEQTLEAIEAGKAEQEAKDSQDHDVIDLDDKEDSSDDAVGAKSEDDKGFSSEPTKPKDTPSVSKPKPTEPTVSKPTATTKPTVEPNPTETTKPAPKITYSEVVSYKDVAFKTSTVYDDTVDKNNGVVTRNGANGQDKITTIIKYSDGKEVSRSSKTVRVKNPVDKVVTVGTKVSEPAPSQGLNVLTSSAEITKMFNAINADRAKQGLNPLSISGELSRAAGVRTAEIVEVFSHTRPDGSSFSTVSNKAYGENIAYGSSDGEITHGRFMDSQGHKENILRTRWKTVGIASVRPDGLPTYWTVLFGD